MTEQDLQKLILTLNQSLGLQLLLFHSSLKEEAASCSYEDLVK